MLKFIDRCKLQFFNFRNIDKQVLIYYNMRHGLNLEGIMKKVFISFIAATLLLCGCVRNEINDNGKLNIVTTNFAYYDFARAVGGEKVQINMLIKPATNAHSYEPTPEDIINTSKSDLFICNGGENEKWAENIIKNAKPANVLRVLDIIPVQDKNQHNADEHVWTSPVNAEEIVREILNKLVSVDEENKDYYINNADGYISKLEELDNNIQTMANNSKRNVLVFGDRFPFSHFAERYNFECLSAFGGCAHDSEPDAKTVAMLCDKVKEEKIPVVFYIEMSTDKTAKAVCEGTNAKPLMLHSCHNVSKAEFERGETYISLMNKNLENLKEALN